MSFTSRISIKTDQSKVALKRVVDDFSTLAVEQCLVGRLPFLLRPEMIHEMSEEEIFQLASETQDTTNQREKCMERLVVLQAGLHELRSLDKHRLSSQRKLSHRITVKLAYMYLPIEGSGSRADNLDRGAKPRDDSIAENSASQIEGTPGESLAEVIEEISAAPDSVCEVGEEVAQASDAIPDTSDTWGFPLTKKKGKKAKRPTYDWD
jgi:hypothetical protein